jgi:patatin-like phospholipase/acyl hydrolase
MALHLKPGEAANLLSLDGGGIKGISAVVILQAIMDKIRDIEDGGKSQKTPDRLPVDYFHLAAGTSTGGIIALMLFRLRMSPAQAKDAYTEMAQKIFAKKTFFDTGFGRFPDAPLIKAIDDIVARYGRSDNDKNNKGGTTLVDNQAKM